MAAAVIVGVPVASWASGPPDVGLVGNDRILWVYQKQLGAEGNPLLRFAHCVAEGPFKNQFMPRAAMPLAGTASRAALRGDSLHVFFSDGMHFSYAPSAGRTPGMLTTRRRELNLPQAALPAVIAGDDDLMVLFAVLTARQAARIPHGDTSAADEPSDVSSGDVKGEGDTAVPADEGEADLFASARIIVRYDRGVWRLDRPCPDDLALEADVLAMWAGGGTIDLAYRADDPTSTWVHRRSSSRDGEWSDAIALPCARDISSLSVARADTDPILLVSEKLNDGYAVRSLRFDGLDWIPGPGLQDKERGSERFSTAVAPGWFNGTVALASVDDAGDCFVGFWSHADGAVIEEPARVAPLAVQPPDGAWRGMRRAIEYAALAAVLAVVFIWRRPLISRAFPTAPGQVPAGLGRRAGALGIDVLITMPVWGVLLLMTVDFTSFPAGSWTEPARQPVPPGVEWAQAMVGSVFAVYAMLFEWAMGTTPGKRMVGLRVVREGGRRPGFVAVVLRNIIRPIEFQFPPICLLVAVTVGRQRFGDLLARTAVVETVPVDLQEEGPPNGTS